MLYVVGVLDDVRYLILGVVLNQCGGVLCLGTASLWMSAQSPQLYSRQVKLVKLAMGSSAWGWWTAVLLNGISRSESSCLSSCCSSLWVGHVKRKCLTILMPILHAHDGSVCKFLLCKKSNRWMWPVLSCVIDKTECLFLRCCNAFICSFGWGWWPSRLISCFVKLLIVSFLVHPLMAALEFANVGLSTSFLGSVFFDAADDILLACLLPEAPQWPGHQRRVAFITGVVCSMIVVASTLCVSALEFVFFVDISFTNPCLSGNIVIFIVVRGRKGLASCRACM